MKKEVKAFLIAIPFAILLAYFVNYASEAEHAEDVCVRMSEAEFVKITETIGTNDLVKVAAYYEQNKR